MTLEEFHELGERDSERQDIWAVNRDKALTKLWRCDCGKRLPRKGFVWQARYRNFLSDQRFAENPQCGYYCDVCADARERGMDY